MFGFFKSKPLLSDQDLEFQIATYKWLLKHFGGDDFYKEAKLILPTREYFPAKVDSEEEAVESTFGMVKKYAGMEEWPCRLEAQEEDVDTLVAPTIAIQNAPTTPLGTFQAKSDDEIVITYNPSIANEPTQLVATFAHELSHYLTGTTPEDPPGGWDNWEFATDITATFLGFGIFMANSAFNFSQFTSAGSQGWHTSGSGYLSESEHIYALAIFLLLKKMPIESASKFLKPNLKKLLKAAVSEINNSNIIQELLSVECLEAS